MYMYLFDLHFRKCREHENLNFPWQNGTTPWKPLVHVLLGLIINALFTLPPLTKKPPKLPRNVWRRKLNREKTSCLEYTRFTQSLIRIRLRVHFFTAKHQSLKKLCPRKIWANLFHTPCGNFACAPKEFGMAKDQRTEIHYFIASHLQR